MTPRNKLRRLAASTLGTAITATVTVGLLGTQGASSSALSSVSMGTEPWIGYAPGISLSKRAISPITA